jgi:adenylosuccinate lyase
LRIVQGLVVREDMVARNLETYGVFAATERVLMEVVKAGGNRQALHEVIRQHSLVAWEALRQGKPNPLAESLAGDAQLTRWLSRDRITALLDATNYVGEAPERALALALVLRLAAD